MKGPVNC